MKLALLLLAVSQLALATSTYAKTINENFAYDFLNPGKIGFCPGVAVRVLSVGTVGATRSGGCCGTDEVWAQNTRLWPFGNGGIPRNFRADIEAQSQGFDLRAQAFDASLKNHVPAAAAIMEQLPIQNGQVSACVSKLDMVSLNQNHSIGTEINFDMAIKYYVSLDGANGRETILVQEVEGQKTVSSAFYHLYYDFSPRAQNFLPNSWAGLQQNIGDVLAPIPNAEAERGLNKVKAYLGEYIGSDGQ